ncbi:unnamed protein product [Amoebophrya sp. A25]|nr:unnamed protein product [Amoebophrya sp. A25]|eukprot:GSA25T00004002001.1
MFPCCFCSEEPVTPRGDRLEQAQSLQVVPSTAKAAAVRGTSLSDNSKSQVEAATIAPGAENTSIAAAGADVTATIVPGAAAPGGTTGTNTTVTVGAVEKGVVEESTTTASATSSSTVAAAANKVEERRCQNDLRGCCQ